MDFRSDLLPRNPLPNASCELQVDRPRSRSCLSGSEHEAFDRYDYINECVGRNAQLGHSIGKESECLKLDVDRGSSFIFAPLASEMKGAKKKLSHQYFKTWP